MEWIGSVASQVIERDILNAAIVVEALDRHVARIASNRLRHNLTVITDTARTCNWRTSHLIERGIFQPRVGVGNHPVLVGAIFPRIERVGASRNQVVVGAAFPRHPAIVREAV